MDVLRARAFLDLLLGKDSRPRQDASGGGDGPGPGSDGPGPEDPGTPPPSAGPAGGAAPGGFAGRVTLTVPLATVTGLAGPARRAVRDRPGRPWLARDLAAAAAQNPKTTWCVTVTDEHGHAVGHGCARPEPKGHGKRAGPGRAGPPGFTFTPGQPGRAARRVRHLAAAHPRTRAGPDHHPGIADHRPLRPPAPGQRPRPRGQAEAPDPGPECHLHQPGLPAARRPVRRRPQHPLRRGRPDLPLQHRPEVPPRPPPQAAPEVDSRPAPRRDLPLDHTGRAAVHDRTHEVPHLAAGGIVSGEWWRYASQHHACGEGP